MIEMRKDSFFFYLKAWRVVLVINSKSYCLLIRPTKKHAGYVVVNEGERGLSDGAIFIPLPERRIYLYEQQTLDIDFKR